MEGFWFFFSICSTFTLSPISRALFPPSASLSLTLSSVFFSPNFVRRSFFIGQLGGHPAVPRAYCTAGCWLTFHSWFLIQERGRQGRALSSSLWVMALPELSLSDLFLCSLFSSLHCTVSWRRLEWHVMKQHFNHIMNFTRPQKWD